MTWRAVVNTVVSGAESKVATDDESVEAEALDLSAKSLIYVVVVHVLDVEENWLKDHTEVGYK